MLRSAQSDFMALLLPASYVFESPKRNHWLSATTVPAVLMRGHLLATDNTDGHGEGIKVAGTRPHAEKERRRTVAWRTRAGDRHDVVGLFVHLAVEPGGGRRDRDGPADSSIERARRTRSCNRRR